MWTKDISDTHNSEHCSTSPVLPCQCFQLRSFSDTFKAFDELNDNSFLKHHKLGTSNQVYFACMVLYPYEILLWIAPWISDCGIMIHHISATNVLTLSLSLKICNLNDNCNLGHWLHSYSFTVPPVCCRLATNPCPSNCRKLGKLLMLEEYQITCDKIMTLITSNFKFIKFSIVACRF